ncbi:phage tail protein [Photorhabdus heterorhabditis]|uniref:phage tail protein n=1 Tax=Photorhabdus heterorhabditis TaxID=880156 RepID=UPI0020B8D8C0|nr:phage tail protein [Photorhabdus heterorhabditis]
MAEGANVLSNEEYATLAARVNGFTAGVAKSRELNKAWRQSSIITHILAQYIADESGNDVLDNGDIDALKKSLAAAIKNALPEVRDATLTEKGIIQLSNATDSTSEKLAATSRAVKYAYDLANSANTNANTKLSKSQNGADIPDKNAFVKNLGLLETVELAKNAVSANGGNYPGYFRFKQVETIPNERNAVVLASESGGRPAGTMVSYTLYNWYDNYAKAGIVRGGGVDTLGYAVDINAKRVLTIYKNGIVVPADYGNFDDRYDNIPVGVPMPYPHRYTPVGYLACNGQAFDKSLYPKLAEAYPGGRVPDLRGEFIRGWDDSRGVDPGRVCGTWQGDAMQNITGSFSTYRAYVVNATGAFSTFADTIKGNTTAGDDYGKVVNFDASRVVPTASETRPRNIAFNYIVRAA